MSFDIGQKVVCVDDKFDDWVLSLYTALPVKDRTYVVRDVRIGAVTENGKRRGAISLLLVGLVNPGVPGSNSAMAERGFNSDRFRTLEEMKQSKAEELAEAVSGVRLTEEIIQTALQEVELNLGSIAFGNG